MQTYNVSVPRGPLTMVVVQDPESQRESPVETKHLKLARSHRSYYVERDLKPNPAVRNQLNVGARGARAARLCDDG